MAAILKSKRAYGKGISIRHSRSCRAPNNDAECPCGPSFEAWVYVPNRGKKRRRSFHSFDEARRWRLSTLRQMYGEKVTKPGKLDEAYSHIRKAAQEFDRALALMEPPMRAHVRAALEATYEAEEAAFRVVMML